MKASTQTQKYKSLSLVSVSLFRFIKDKPLGFVGALIVIVLLVSGIFADSLAPYGMNQIDLAHSLEAPSPSHLLGTDNLGRDVLSRVIFGARVSMIVGLSATVISVFVSTLIGVTSGYFGGIYDLLMQRFVDTFMCFPGLVLLIVIISFLGPGMWQIIIVLGIQFGITGSRVMRGAAISVKENIYIDAGRAIGCSRTHIIIRHILPNIMAPIIVLFSTRVPGVILTEASLSFLGFGIPPPTPSWGGMLSGPGRANMFLAPWMVLWPGVALSSVVYGINMLGDAIRDKLDPRLRGGSARYGKINKKALKKHMKI